MNTFDAIAARRSTKRLDEPAPNDEQLRQMFIAASRAPDHKELRPWQFIVLRGEKKRQLGEVMAKALKARDPQATDGQLNAERA